MATRTRWSPPDCPWLLKASHVAQQRKMENESTNWASLSCYFHVATLQYLNRICILCLLSPEACTSFTPNHPTSLGDNTRHGREMICSDYLTRAHVLVKSGKQLWVYPRYSCRFVKQPTALWGVLVEFRRCEITYWQKVFKNQLHTPPPPKKIPYRGYGCLFSKYKMNSDGYKHWMINTRLPLTFETSNVLKNGIHLPSGLLCPVIYMWLHCSTWTGFAQCLLAHGWRRQVPASHRTIELLLG